MIKTSEQVRKEVYHSLIWNRLKGFLMVNSMKRMKKTMKKKMVTSPLNSFPIMKLNINKELTDLKPN